MYHFCTYFDSRYLPRGLALYQSLRQHCRRFKLWVLCLDDICYDVLGQLALEDVQLIALDRFEAGDEELLSAKQNRTPVEYYFTITPSLPLFILKAEPNVELITYLDSDFGFFSDPSPIFDEIDGRSIAIIGHRFPARRHHLEIYGIYNVGWLSFRRDRNGLACLEWWREKCIEWCYDRCEEERFADQKYLDSWPSLFEGIAVLEHKGANLAPWNLDQYEIRFDGNSVWVDGQPLVFFHFQGLKRIWWRLYDSGWWMYDLTPPRVVRRHIYAPYIRTLMRVTQELSPSLNQGKTTKQVADLRPPPAKSTIRKLGRICRRTLSGNNVFVLGHGLWNDVRSPKGRPAKEDVY